MSSVEPDPRLGPRAKIERAKEHLADLKLEIGGFIAGDPYKFRVHDDPDGTRHLILESRKPIPLRWSAIVGDIVHNSRSALDLLVTCSGRLETESDKEFPFRIFRKRTDFEKKAFEGFGNHCPRTIRFLKLLKPYERLHDTKRPSADLGHHANTIFLLKTLSNRDKHELIIPVGTVAGRAIVTPKPGFGEPFELLAQSTSLMCEGEIVITISPFDPLFANKDFNTQVTTSICLGGVEGLPFIGAHSVLAHIVKIVDRIVGIAERRLFR